MPTPDPIAPDRLEELLGGVVPEGEREALVQGIVRELRTEAPVAPAPLRQRVRTLADRPARRRPALPRRRTALAIAFALVALAGVSSAVFMGEGEEPTAVEAPALGEQAEAEAAEKMEAPFAMDDRFQPRRTLMKEAAPPSAPPPTHGRATDVALSMEVRLSGAEELSAAAAEAMDIARGLGGWVAASDIDTEANEGEATLALRVPVGRVEDAVVRLGDLGTVTGERVATVDLQTGIDRRNDRVERLERAVRMLEIRIQSGTLTPEQELRAKLQIERHENEIDDLRRAIRADKREAATSELSLVLHTREAAAKQDEDKSGAAGAAGNALDFLAAAGTIALFLVIILSPAVLLVVLLWLAFRARSRRVEAKLLDRPDPASPPPA